MRTACDIAIVGSGFAGSITAMIARRLGRSVMLLEKGRHPRFVIGESSTPLANLLIEELADRYDLPTLRPFSKFGCWQAAHPEIAVGLKRGFTFFHHRFGERFAGGPEHLNELLVAASPNDRIGDTHWYRPDFDAFLAGEARRLGAEYLDEVDLWGVDTDAKRPMLQGRHRGQPLEIHAGLIIDASGQRGFLHRALELPELPLKDLPPTQGLWSHFTGVQRWDELHPAESTPPYPVDDAAVHHVFDGGWIWVLRFNNGITSAGAALEKRLANELNAAAGAAAWERLLERLPSVREQFAEAKAAIPFVHAKQVSFLSGSIAGPNWVMLPSAAGFVDPLLSTGFALTLLGVERLARILESKWECEDLPDELCQYSMQTTMEIASTGRLIAALYASMRDFEVFRALTLLYFAAASFTESARRLGKPELAGGTFLLGERAEFHAGMRDCVAMALQRPQGTARATLLAKIQETIGPVNIAGLGDAARAHWYPALANDLFGGANKLQASRGEIEAMLRRCGFVG
jgi:FADH2 O2-dependent halogenase